MAPSDDDLSLYAHLATIAFRESVAKADESTILNGCKVKALVIARDYEAVIEKLYQPIPGNVARRTLAANKSHINSSLDHDYELVLSLMRIWKENPSKDTPDLNGKLSSQTTFRYHINQLWNCLRQLRPLISFISMRGWYQCPCRPNYSTIPCCMGSTQTTHRKCPHNEQQGSCSPLVSLHSALPPRHQTPQVCTTVLVIQA